MFVRFDYWTYHLISVVLDGHRAFKSANVWPVFSSYMPAKVTK